VVILAAGGGGGVYARNNNTADITGDSYSLAYDAGAALRDMEFVQFYPNMILSPIKINISSSLFGEGAFLRNAHGEKFMKNYDKKEDMATRDMMSRAILNEMTAGRGHASGVFLDCRKVSRETFVTKYGKLLPLLSKVNIDPSNDFIPITPATHFFMGGIAVNNRCESTIPGLLACGESAGGLHGANRLAGNALSETFVFGMIAGDQAAHLSKEKYRIDVPTFDIVPSQSGTLSVSEIKQYLRKSNWKYLSISRDKKSIEKAIAIINEVSTSFGNIRIKTVYDLVSFFELKCMNSTARLIAESGRHRTESRGAHFRSDYPVMNDESHKGSYYSVKCNGKLKIRFQPIDS
jgi:aspartate oxidase